MFYSDDLIFCIDGYMDVLYIYEIKSKTETACIGFRSYRYVHVYYILCGRTKQILSEICIRTIHFALNISENKIAMHVKDISGIMPM